MSLAKIIRPSLAIAVAAAGLPAQESVLPRLRAVHAAAEPGTERWFASGFEVVEAELLCDRRRALATATGLWDAVDAASPPGAAATASAMAALACARLEGPTHALIWVNRQQATPVPSSPLFRVYFHLAIARQLCAQGKHSQELEHSIPGQACADQLAVYPLRLRAAMTTMQATPQRSLVSFRRLMQEARRSSQAATVECFGPWLAIEEVQLKLHDDRGDEVPNLLNEIEAGALRDGNLQILGIVASLRAGLHRRRGDQDAALDCVEQARDAFERLGDCNEVAACIDMQAVIETQRGNYELALTLLDVADEHVRGRGLLKMEDELLRTRFQLAVRRHDGDAAAALAAEIERHQHVLQEDSARLAEARENLARAEEERAEVQQRLQAEHVAAQQEAAEARLWAGGGVALLLALFAGLQWKSRRRLQTANRQLARQVMAVEQAKAEQAQLELRMRQLERAESLSTLAAGVAHDFNNLLTSILGNAELLQFEQVSETGASLAAAIRTAGQQAARLCRQLQTYAGGAPLDQQPCDLVGITRDMRDMLRSSTGGALTIEIDSTSERIGALADRGQLEQVLLNLILNAKDANAHRVAIHVTRAEQAEGIAGPVAVLTVTDDGDGMTPEVLRRVFDPFFTTRFPGRGLGLAVVYGAVRRQGGTVHVSSTPQQGACFTIRLPLIEVPPPAEPQVVLPSVPPRPAFMSTWVVDDEPAVREMLVRMLRMLGHEATAVADGDAFLHAVSRLPEMLPVAAFVDLTMPGMDGPEVVRCLRELRDGTRVVLMTGHSTDQLEQVAAELRPVATLSKPFQIADLQRIVALLCVSAAPRVEATPATIATAP